MRKFIALTAASLTAMALAAVPANAAPIDCASGVGCDTDVTFTLTGSGLSLTVADDTTVTLAGGTLTALGSSVEANLHSTTVNDARGLLTGGAWAVDIASTAFTTTGHTIPASQGQAWLDGFATAQDITDNIASLGSGAAVPTTGASIATPVDLGVGGDIISGATVGTGSATYTPHVKVNITADDIAGVYTGTVTQTVS